ncbi:phage scaffold protein [Schleiferilactobacillus harbinensis DSM 16991]|uniref:Phage scaffold protein n=1 Tax=Schleiferilactobacillus harbinensis DSM 16991 TaxID=1122147 RepID=A0A0R1XFH5_9LACO|nr:phage scaffold protein [Schleiferilactobacillus harbinensis DSM 16991]
MGLYQRSFLFWDSEDCKNQAAPETEAPDTQQTDPATPDQQNTETEQQEQSFTQSQLDSEADKRVAKALAKAKADYQSQLDKVRESAKSEGEKYAKMTAQQKADAEFQAKQDALDKRQADLDRRELKANIGDSLHEKGLPAELADTLVVIGDAEKIHAVLDTVSDTIQKQVAEGIREKLQQNPPKAGASNLSGADDPFKDKLNKYK